MGRYVFFGTGKYARHLYGSIRPDELLGACDNYKKEDTWNGKPVFPINNLHSLHAERQAKTVIAIEEQQYLHEIAGQLTNLEIPFIFASQLLVEKGVYDIELYPSPLRNLFKCLLATYEQGTFRSLNHDEKYQLSQLECRYRKVVLFMLPFSSTGHFGAAFKAFCEMRDTNREPDVCYGICKEISNYQIVQFDVPNEFLYQKILSSFPDIRSNNLNIWMHYISAHINDVSLVQYNDIMERNIRNFHKQFRRFCLDFQTPNKGANISFTKEETLQGKARISELGLTKKYVCFFARDNKYVKTFHRFLPEKIFDVDGMYRNFAVNSYGLMASELYKRGIQAVRMGSLVQEAYTGEGIDYSSLGPTDFMDAYIFSGCLFSIIGDSGIEQIPIGFFRKPVICIVCPGYILSKGDPNDSETELLLFHRMFDSKQDKFLSLREILDLSKEVDFDIYRANSDWLKKGIQHVPANEREIWDAAHEMLKLLDGSQEYSDEDIRLRETYREIIWEYAECDKSIGGFLGYPCAKWLRDNPWFLQ